MAVVNRLQRIQEVALCLIRKWWRPITCIWLCGTMAVHGVILPLADYWQHGELRTDLMALAALVTAVAGAFAVREWGKAQRLGDDDEEME
mgnify:CR=1 FL=1